MNISEREVRRLLAEHDLPDHDEGVARLHSDLETAFAVSDRSFPTTFKRSDADRVRKALALLKPVFAASPTLVNENGRCALNDLSRLAEARLSMPAKPGRGRRPWLWPSAKTFLATWNFLKNSDGDIWNRDGPNPALLFVTACCKVIDEEVTVHAVITAKQNCGHLGP